MPPKSGILQQYFYASSIVLQDQSGPAQLKFTGGHLVYFPTAAMLLAHVLTRLHHIKKPFKIFITYRVTKIHAFLPQCQWGHITTEDNPADPASRSLLPAAMIADRLHRDGPAFVRLPEDQWHMSSIIPISVDQLPDLKTFKKFALMAIEITSLDLILSRFSSFTRLRRSSAYALLKQLSRHISVTLPSIAKLATFWDDIGLIRARGRLINTMLSWDVKHPLLSKISTFHVLTKILFGRDAIRRNIFTYVKCTRQNAVHPAPFMGQIPSVLTESIHVSRHGLWWSLPPQGKPSPKCQ
ncbi:Hypothetical protein CINCED_3A025661, partial [Cinara cedri]